MRDGKNKAVTPGTSSVPRSASPIPHTEGLDALGEEVWIEVIRKMDEVYNDLLQYEVALEEKNTALEESQQFVFSVLASMSDILVVCDRSGRIEVVNQALVAFSGKPEQALIGTPLFDLFADADARVLHAPANHGQPARSRVCHVLPDQLVPDQYDKIRLISKPVKISPDTSMDGIQVPWIMTPIIPKIIVKPSVVDTIATGGHGVSKQTLQASTAEPDDLVIAHLPFSTLDRFQTKLENIDKTMVNAADLFVGLEGWHWRRWNAIWRAGKTEQEFNWQWMSPEQLQQALATGQVQTVNALFATLAEQSRTAHRGATIRRLFQSLKNQFQM